MSFIKHLFSEYISFLQEHPQLKETFFFWLKSSAALILTCFLAFEFETPEAAWAIICAGILVHPDSGAVLSKSIARIIGTAIGASLAIFLFYLFPQAPWIFLLSTSLWVGLCSYYSAYTKDFKTYAVALSGFMPLMIFMTAIQSNAIDEVVRIASVRASTISLGIICVAIVFGLTHIRKGYKGFLHSMKEVNHHGYTVLSQQLQYINNYDQIRSMTTFFEGLKRQFNYAAAEDPEITLRAKASRCLINDMFGATVDLNNYIKTLQKYQLFTTADQTHFAAFLELLLLPQNQLIQSLENFLENPQIKDPGLLRRTMLLAKFTLYLQKEFTDTPITMIPRRMGTFVDLWLTNQMAMGAFLVTFSASLIWILSEWPIGPFFITFVAASYLLQTNKDHYGREAIFFFLGACLAIIPAFIAQQIFMPITYGFVWFSFWLSMAILPATILKASAKYNTIGIGCFLFTLILVFPSNAMNYDFQLFLNTYLASIAACALSVSGIILTMPWNPAQRIQRLLKIGLDTVKELPFLPTNPNAISERLDIEQERYELLVRFYNNQLLTKDETVDKQFLAVVSMIRIFEINHSLVVDLNENRPTYAVPLQNLWRNFNTLDPENIQNLFNKIDELVSFLPHDSHELLFLKETCKTLLMEEMHVK